MKEVYRDRENCSDNILSIYKSRLAFSGTAFYFTRISNGKKYELAGTQKNLKGSVMGELAWSHFMSI
ncbi:hypothetical protein Cpin_3109 [Chitinophaga pinensis DSM 2588]|uniref:Uncharacterized protein n=1 Tax=Chitinophaga pinensis (strain ATCC 43595 / DSM 2588 / LMG 13176 / NBRC 15968 / NCIMB 11800 / UQM 2034) TaxID=485918 RepID=A0A979G4K3_CHIPD|nr:hypothetical protein Cpin_3109 [Chitinophaga pinensis DSM 2588]